jgi:hypothetical protein
MGMRERSRMKSLINTQVSYVGAAPHYAVSSNLLYCSPSIVRVIKATRMRWAGHVARMGEVRGAYNILVGRPKGRRPLGRPRRR